MADETIGQKYEYFFF